MIEDKGNALDDADIKIWDKPYREPGIKESTTAFETFIIYRDMGTRRTLGKVAEKVGKKYEAVRHWSYKYKWTDRINAMNKYKIQEANKINKEIQRDEVNRINQRLEAKGKLINVLMQVLIRNASKYKDTELDFKEFSSMLNLVSRIENMNIADLENIKSIEQLITDDAVDASNINTMVNNFNVLLGANNSDAIDAYQEELKKDEY